MSLPEIVTEDLLWALLPSEPEKPSAPTSHDAPTYAEVEEALRHLPAHFGVNSYDTWRDVLMAVHSVFPGPDGVALCERYVPGKPGEIQRKFASFNGTGGVQIGTLFHIAKNYGYQPAASYSAKEDWPELGNDDIDALMQGTLLPSLPEIQVNNRQLSGVIADLKTAICQRNQHEPANPILLKRGGILVRVGDNAILPVAASGLNGVAADVARWITVKQGKDDTPIITDVFPPRDVVNTYLGMGEWPELPELKGLLTAPAYVGDGRWVDQPGYDPESGLYLVNSITVGDTTPTPERVAWAKEQILVELLGDFPFKDDASRAHAVALVLLPFVRHIIQGPTPLHLADAPTAGTGKGLFVSACCYPAVGADVPSMSAGRDDDEWRKRLTAVLQGGGSHVNIDNIPGRLDSSALATALTQSLWEDRQLGSTHMLRLPIRTVWAATGNNVQPSDEIARRCIWIRLDSNMERPQERTGFRHANLLGWAREYRGDLIAAAMTLINNWAAKGEPSGNYVKGSFQEWASVLGGILDAAGIPGFLANERELFAATVNELQLWGAFVEAWAEKHNSFPVTTKDLFALASHYDTPPTNGPDGLGLLDDLLGAGNERSRQTRLGKQLGQMADRVIRGWKIQRGGIVKGYQQWSLARGLSNENESHVEPSTIDGNGVRSDGVDVVDPTSTPLSPEVQAPWGGRGGRVEPTIYIENIDPDPNTFLTYKDEKTFTMSTNVHPHTGKNGVDVAIQRPPHDPTSTLIDDLGL